MKYISIYLGFILLNVLIAKINDTVRRHRIKNGIKKQINHPAWAVFYTACCAVPYFLIDVDSFHVWFIPIKVIWPFLFALLAQHLSFFPVAYNLISDAPSIFFLSKETTAKTDQFMVRMGLKSTESVNIAALIVSVAAFIYTLFNL